MGRVFLGLAGLKEFIFQSGAANSRYPNMEYTVSVVQKVATEGPSVIMSQQLQIIFAATIFLATEVTTFSGTCTTGQRGGA